MLLRAENLDRFYGSGNTAVHALRNVAFVVEDGEFVAIMGPSGSGKSTLMNLVALLDRPSGGRLLLFGRDVTRMNDDALSRLRNREIGIVFQSYNLLARSTAHENVALPLVYAGVGGRRRAALAEEALDRVGLRGRMRNYPNQLSGGEQQRVAIARALVCDPSLILADEPTGALDSLTGELILGLLCDLHASGRTVILITHDPEIAARAHRIIRLRDGALLSDEPVPMPAAVADIPMPARERVP